MKYGKLLQDFCEYMQKCERSGFRAEGIAVGSPCKPYPHYSLTKGTGANDYGKRVITGPLLNRWHPDRRRGWIARMHQLAQWYDANRIEGCTLVSLTGYQENSGLSWYDTLDNINESRVKLLKILRKYLGKAPYFWIVEPHTENDTGYPHYHLVVFRYVDNEIKDAYGEGMEDKLRRLYSEEWKTGSHTYGLDFQQMKGENSIQDLKNYLMKYISKGYINDKPWTPGELIFNAHLYGATHEHRPPKEGEVPDFKGRYTKKYRIIGMSRDLSDLLRPEKEDREDIVWLHIDETEPEITRKDPWTGEETVICEPQLKLLYHRQLIPDWLAPDPIMQDWGRPTPHRTYRELANPHRARRSSQRYDPAAGDTATADEIARALGKI